MSSRPSAERQAAPTEERVGLSVVVPVFNPGRSLADLLASLERQVGGEPWELVVADNGSTDGATDLARSFASRIPSLLPVDASDCRGGAHARNVGVRASSGPKLVFLDQDDQVGPGYLAAMVAALDDHPFVAARLDHEELNSGWVARSLLPWQTERLANAFGYLPHANFGSLGIRRSLFDEVGGIDERLRHADDVAFCWAVQMSGVDLTLAEGAVLRYRHRSDVRSYLRQEWVSGIEDFELYRRFGDRGMPFPSASLGRPKIEYVRELRAIRSREQALRWLGGSARRAGRLVGRRRDRT